MAKPIIPIDKLIEQYASKMDFLTREAAAGKITVRQWQRDMATLIRESHIRAGLAGRGGDAPLLDRIGLWAQREKKIFDQTRYLNKWAAQIRSGAYDAESLLGRIRAQARLYANNARDTYQQTAQTVAKAIGRTEKRRVLGPSERSCNTCPQQAALGWVPIDSPAVTGIADGSTDCGPGCNCTIEYR